MLSNRARDGALALLTPGERDRLGRLTHPTRRDQYLLGHLLARLALADAASVPMWEVSILENAGGPPQWQRSGRIASHTWFSLSHSRNHVACLVGKLPVGLDMEVMDSSRNFSELAQYAFSESERRMLQSMNAFERPLRFYTLWCRKEARFKLESTLEKNSPGQVTTPFFADYRYGDCAVSICGTAPMTHFRVTALVDYPDVKTLDVKREFKPLDAPTIDDESERLIFRRRRADLPS